MNWIPIPYDVLQLGQSWLKVVGRDLLCLWAHSVHRENLQVITYAAVLLGWCCKRRSAVNLCPSYLRRCSKCGVATIFTLVIKAVQSTWRWCNTSIVAVTWNSIGFSMAVASTYLEEGALLKSAARCDLRPMVGASWILLFKWFLVEPFFDIVLVVVSSFFFFHVHLLDSVLWYSLMPISIFFLNCWSLSVHSYLSIVDLFSIAFWNHQGRTKSTLP